MTFSPAAVFYSLTQAVVSALVVLEVAHSQRIRGDLLAALGERLDDVETRPRAKLLILHALTNTHTMIRILYTTFGPL